MARSLFLGLAAALVVSACFSGATLNRPPYRYNEPISVAPAVAPAKADATTEKKPVPLATPAAPVANPTAPGATPAAPAPTSPAPPPANPGG